MFISRCVDFVRVGSESGVLHIMLKFFTITLMLDAQRVSLVTPNASLLCNIMLTQKRQCFKFPYPHFTET